MYMCYESEVIVQLIEGSSVICWQQTEFIPSYHPKLPELGGEELSQRMSITASSLPVMFCVARRRLRPTKTRLFCHILKIVWRQSEIEKYVASVDSNFVSSLPT